MSCGCQNNDAVSTVKWNSNCPDTFSNGGNGGNGGNRGYGPSGMSKSGFCFKCSTFWLFVIGAIVLFWILTDDNGKGSK